MTTKKILYAFIILILFSSCSSMKSFFSKDTSTKDTKTEVVETTKKGGKTTLELPNIIYKDTTITSVNYETKTILRTTFDTNGNQKIDCLEAEINEKITRIEEAIQNDIATKDKRETSFNPQYFMYAIAALGFIIIIGFVVFGVVVTKIKKELVS